MTIQNCSTVLASLLLMLSLAGTPVVQALDIELPEETAAYQPSELPGYALVQKNCLLCHAAQYVQSQPRTSPRSYWEATVHKMKKPFGAPVAEADMPGIVDYLVKTYGAEHSMPLDTPVTAQKVSASDARKPAASGDAQTLIGANGCTACHAVDHKIVGPAFKDVAAKYAGKADAAALVAKNIRAGGSGKWGPVAMPPFPGLSDEELKTLSTWIIAR